MHREREEKEEEEEEEKGRKDKKHRYPKCTSLTKQRLGERAQLLLMRTAVIPRWLSSRVRVRGTREGRRGIADRGFLWTWELQKRSIGLLEMNYLGISASRPAAASRRGANLARPCDHLI